MANGKQSYEILPAEMGEEEHEADECEERKQCGLKILTLGEVVERAVTLRPGNDCDQDSDEKQKDAAQQEKGPWEPV